MNEQPVLKPSRQYAPTTFGPVTAGYANAARRRGAVIYGSARSRSSSWRWRWRGSAALPEDELPGLGFYYRDGFVSRTDWPGTQAVWAIGELSRLGPFVWAILAAVPVAALAILMRRRRDAGWGLAAAVIFLCSPMALMLSMTSHAHLGSRAMLAW